MSSQLEVSVDPTKIQSLVNWPVPYNAKGVCGVSWGSQETAASLLKIMGRLPNP